MTNSYLWFWLNWARVARSRSNLACTASVIVSRTLRRNDAPLEAAPHRDYFIGHEQVLASHPLPHLPQGTRNPWQAFVSSETPVHLKALMLLVPAYLLSPIDLIPDVFPVLGWIDDFIVVPLLVSWIVRMLPKKVEVCRHSDGGKVIDGDYRRR